MVSASLLSFLIILCGPFFAVALIIYYTSHNFDDNPLAIPISQWLSIGTLLKGTLAFLLLWGLPYAIVALRVDSLAVITGGVDGLILTDVDANPNRRLILAGSVEAIAHIVLLMTLVLATTRLARTTPTITWIAFLRFPLRTFDALTRGVFVRRLWFVDTDLVYNTIRSEASALMPFLWDAQAVIDAHHQRSISLTSEQEEMLHKPQHIANQVRYMGRVFGWTQFNNKLQDLYHSAKPQPHPIYGEIAKPHLGVFLFENSLRTAMSPYVKPPPVLQSRIEELYEELDSGETQREELKPTLNVAGVVPEVRKHTMWFGAARPTDAAQ